MLKSREYIHYPSDTPPRLLVVIDTEEEFDWELEPDTNSTSIHAINDIYRVQEIFNEYNITPCYVVDHPIARKQESIDVLKPILDKGQCEIGAHLHPWVNPPYGEVLSRSNMYPGNLNFDMEYNKLKKLTERIKKSFGISPEIYRAGRCGVGKNTTDILKKLGYAIDLSVCPTFDYRYDGGPDFSNFRTDPFWFGEKNELLEIPLTGALVGLTGGLSSHIYQAAGYLEVLKVRGMLSRLSIIDRILLSPEGYTSAEHKKLTRFLYNQGVRTFTWNFHSATVVPGMTVYTQTKQDVNNFLDSFRRYFDFFFGELKGVATTPTQLKKELKM